MIDNVKSQPTLKRLNIATGLAAIEDLIESVEIELAKEMSERFKKHKRHAANERVGFISIYCTEYFAKVVRCMYDVK